MPPSFLASHCLNLCLNLFHTLQPNPSPSTKFRPPDQTQAPPPRSGPSTKFTPLNQIQTPQPNSSPSTKLTPLSQTQTPLIPPSHLDNPSIHHKPHRSQGHMVLSLCAGCIQKQACRSECYERADGPCTLCGDASHNVRTGWHVYFDQTWQSMFSQVVNRHSTEQHTCG